MTHPTPAPHAAGEAEAGRIDLDALESVAKAATQGEWKVAGDPVEFGLSAIKFSYEYDANEFTAAWLARELSKQDAKYIATFDPPTVLALLARLRKADAAAAQSHALVTKAVTVAIEAACSTVCPICADKGEPEATYYEPRNGYLHFSTWCVASRIRALDVPTLVAAALAAEEKP